DFDTGRFYRPMSCHYDLKSDDYEGTVRCTLEYDPGEGIPVLKVLRSEDEFLSKRKGKVHAVLFRLAGATRCCLGEALAVVPLVRRPCRHRLGGWRVLQLPRAAAKENTGSESRKPGVEERNVIARVRPWLPLVCMLLGICLLAWVA